MWLNNLVLLLYVDRRLQLYLLSYDSWLRFDVDFPDGIFDDVFEASLVNIAFFDDFIQESELENSVLTYLLPVTW